MKTYTVKKVNKNSINWAWKTANVAELNCEPWKEFPCPYKTTVQLLYTEESVYVHFSTTETKLRARNNRRDSLVYEDSCMEFFLSPDENDSRYFNFEINPIGTLLLYVCNGLGNYTNVDIDEKILNIKTIITNNGWELFYEIPFSFITQYFKQISPCMRGNFYKCGEQTEINHCACWNKIDLEEPMFHCPQFFGKIVFE